MWGGRSESFEDGKKDPWFSFMNIIIALQYIHMRTFLQSIYVKNLNSNPIEAVLFLTIGKGSRSHDRVYLQGIFANAMYESPRHFCPSALEVGQKPFVTILVHGFFTVKAA
jgi:hypothetical protein